MYNLHSAINALSMMVLRNTYPFRFKSTTVTAVLRDCHTQLHFNQRVECASSPEPMSRRAIPFIIASVTGKSSPVQAFFANSSRLAKPTGILSGVYIFKPLLDQQHTRTENISSESTP